MKRSDMLKSLLVASMVFAAGLSVQAEAVKGNPDSKVYHKAACKHYTAKGTTKAFASEAEAKEAGYRACKMCDKAKAEKKSEGKKEK